MPNVRAWAAGVKVTVTGLSKKERSSIEEVVDAAGGSYSSTLSKLNTHLVVSNDFDIRNPISDKLAAALAKKDSWCLQIVTLQWILDCHKTQIRYSERDYALNIPLETRKPLAAYSGNNTTAACQATVRAQHFSSSCWIHKINKFPIHLSKLQVIPKADVPASCAASSVPTLTSAAGNSSILPHSSIPGPSRDPFYIEPRQIEFTQAGFLPLKVLLQKLDVADDEEKPNKARTDAVQEPSFPV